MVRELGYPLHSPVRVGRGEGAEEHVSSGNSGGHWLIGSTLLSVTGGLFWAVAGCGARTLDGPGASPREEDGAPCACPRDAWFDGRCSWRQ